MTSSSRYSSPLAERYASKPMLELWSSAKRHGLWRQLWLALAEAEKELGVPIPDEAITQMKAHLDDIDFDVVAAYERRFRHDVMAHVHAFGDVAPAALLFLMSAIPRMIHLEETFGTVTGHVEAVALVERFLDRVEPRMTGETSQDKTISAHG